MKPDCQASPKTKPRPSVAPPHESRGPEGNLCHGPGGVKAMKDDPFDAENDGLPDLPMKKW